MISSTRSRIGRAAVLTAVAAVAVLGSATAAQAATSTSATLVPGQQICVQQYAGYQVRGEGTATNQGAKFKITFNGSGIPGLGSPGLVTGWAAEARSAYGTFPGSGYYSACATNNGTANTKVTLKILTDSEF